MPIVVLKNKLKKGKYEDILSFAFNCEYDNGSLKIKNNDIYFDGHNYDIYIEEAIKKFDKTKEEEYENKNYGIYCLGVLNYFKDEIPGLYSIKFSDDSIFYVDELEKER